MSRRAVAGVVAAGAGLAAMASAGAFVPPMAGKSAPPAAPGSFAERPVSPADFEDFTTYTGKAAGASSGASAGLDWGKSLALGAVLGLGVALMAPEAPARAYDEAMPMSSSVTVAKFFEDMFPANDKKNDKGSEKLKKELENELKAAQVNKASKLRKPVETLKDISQNVKKEISLSESPGYSERPLPLYKTKERRLKKAQVKKGPSGPAPWDIKLDFLPTLALPTLGLPALGGLLPGPPSMAPLPSAWRWAPASLWACRRWWSAAKWRPASRRRSARRLQGALVRPTTPRAQSLPVSLPLARWVLLRSC